MEPIRPDHQTFHSCSCYAHALEVVVWDDIAVDINFWQTGISGSWRGFLKRLEGAWRILRYGSVFVDNVTLQAEDARRLASAINDAAEKLRPHETLIHG